MNQARDAVISLLLAMLANDAWACAGCGVALGERSAQAFLLTGVLLSLVPLGLVGGAVYYIYHRASRADTTSREP